MEAEEVMSEGERSTGSSEVQVRTPERPAPVVRELMEIDQGGDPNTEEERKKTVKISREGTGQTRTTGEEMQLAMEYLTIGKTMQLA